MIKKKRFNAASKIVLGYIAVIFTSALLLCLPISNADGEWLPFIDGLFSATTSVCVTGLTTVSIGAQFSLFGKIVVLFLIQIGGLGLITLTALAFLLVGKRITYNERVTLQESLNKENIQGVVKLVKNIIILVFTVELFGAVLLAPSLINIYGWGDGIFNSVFLSISAFCNSGLVPFDSGADAFLNLTGFAENVIVLLPVAFLIIIGGLGYLTLFDIGGLFKHKKMTFQSKVVLITTFSLILLAMLIYGVLEWNNSATIGNMGLLDKLTNLFFHSVTPRTAGFNTLDVASMTAGSVVLTCFLMFIGGSPASTAGGIKTITFIILLVAIFKTSNEKGDFQFCKRKINNATIQKCLKVVGSGLLLVAVSTLAISICEVGSFSVLEIFFESLSALTTTGLSFGITPFVSVISKIILIFLMFVGRVGAITFTIAIANKKTNYIQEIEYPDSKLMVG